MCRKWCCSCRMLFWLPSRSKYSDRSSVNPPFAGLIENGSILRVDEFIKSLNTDTNKCSQVYQNTKKTFTQFLTTLQQLIREIFDSPEQKLQISDDDDNFLQHTVRSSMMLSVLVMSGVVFNGSAAHFSG